MDVEIEDKELIKLYQTGKSKKLRLPPNIVDKFFNGIATIEAANDIYDLINVHSLNFEKLANTNKYSIRLNIQYRLEFEIKWEEGSQNKNGIFKILKISNHYK